MKKNILFISSYPFPLNKGSNQHAYFFIKALTLNFNVYCIFFVQPEAMNRFDNKINSFDLGIKHFDICYYRKNYRKNKYHDKIKKILAFPYLYMNLATHPYGLSLIKKYIKEYSINIIHFEHFHYVKYAFYLPHNLKKIVVYHDLYHSIDWEKIRFEKRYINKVELLISGFKKYIFEKLLDKRIDKTIFLNPVDMQSKSPKSLFIPHIVNPKIKYTLPRDVDFYNILFLGGYNHPPNRMAVKYIIDEILPILTRRINNFKIHIVGSGSERFKEFANKSCYGNYISIKGFVGNINKVFKDMDIAFFPVLYGGGIKTKIIEAMAAGIPIVTTNEGIYGLKGLPEGTVGLGENEEEILKKLFQLIDNYSLRLRCSQLCKSYVDKHHCYSAVSKRIIKYYSKICDD